MELICTLGICLRLLDISCMQDVSAISKGFKHYQAHCLITVKDGGEVKVYNKRCSEVKRHLEQYYKEQADGE